MTITLAKVYWSLLQIDLFSTICAWLKQPNWRRLWMTADMSPTLSIEHRTPKTTPFLRLQIQIRPLEWEWAIRKSSDSAPPVTADSWTSRRQCSIFSKTIRIPGESIVSHPRKFEAYRKSWAICGGIPFVSAFWFAAWQGWLLHLHPPRRQTLSGHTFSREWGSVRIHMVLSGVVRVC